MPAIKKVSREEIIDAAVELLREGGVASINARSVAKKLGVQLSQSTCPFKIWTN